MRLPGLLQRFGNLLDAADEKTSESDLQSLTRQVAGDAAGALEAAAGGAAKRVKTLDFGIAEGFADLTNQIGTDLKAVSAGDTSVLVEASDEPQHIAAAEHTSGAGPFDGCEAQEKASCRLAELSERVKELESREADRLQSRQCLQEKLEEVEAVIFRLGQAEESEEAAAEAGPAGPHHADDDPNSEDTETMEEMQREFYQLQDASQERSAAVLDTLSQVSASNDHLDSELEFWMGKAKKLLFDLGLEDVPEEVELAIEQDPSAIAVSAEVSSDQVDDAAWKEHSERQHAVQELECRLAELMRHSDESIERVDRQQHEERDAMAKLSAAEAVASAEAAAEAAAQQKLEAARLRKVHAEQCKAVADEDGQASTSPAGATAPGASAEMMRLRSEVDALRDRSRAAVAENASLEERLRTQRAAAAADLERAVPLSSATCWHAVDEPLMKLVTLLVRSSCLRRAFALHLLATYCWLLFLVFWLEKH
eukprot:TRINITY_DN17630_c0_g1_i1.p1 TRINITY_DN17630_c0_g1~~TRINITY_DN17630_c0_g1_i1.p1  ORF type:complete len:482 (-),score=167.35 TRINITY_DN17630_c0_g1_i1:26-1471(-)